MSLNIVLGRGLVTPFQRDGKGDFVNKEGVDLLKADIEELLGIIGPGKNSRGELPWRDDLGTRLHELKHRPLYREELASIAGYMTAEVIRRWETRVRVGKVRVSIEDGRLNIFFSWVAVGYNPSQAEPAQVSLLLEQ